MPKRGRTKVIKDGSKGTEWVNGNINLIIIKDVNYIWERKYKMLEQES